MDLETINLLSNVFGDSPKFIETLVKNGYINQTFTKKSGDKTVSALCVTQYPLNFDEKVLADYIFYCGTDENYRGKGLMSDLIREAISELKNGDSSCAVLIPAEKSLFSFYESLGFETAFYIGESEYFAEKSSKNIKNLTKAEASLFYRKYYDFYGKRPNTLYKSESLFFQSIDEFLFDKNLSAILSDGENFAFALINEKVVLREFTGNSEKNFAEAVSAKYKKPVIVQKPPKNQEIPLGMIYFYEETEIPKNMYMNNMLN